MTEDRTTECGADSSDDYLFRSSFESEPLRSASSLSKPTTGTKTSGRSGEMRAEAAQENSEVDEDASNDYLFPSSLGSEPLPSDSFPTQEERVAIECRIYDGPGEGNGDETDEEREEGRKD